MSNHQRSLVLMVYAYLAALPAGFFLMGMVDDSPFVPAMRGHGAFRACWLMIAAGSLLALAGVIAAGLPALLKMASYAIRARRWDIGLRLAVPFAAAAGLIAWVVGVLAWTGGHWAPIPSAVQGDWLAPANWPPLELRWVLGSITLVLIVAALIASAISLKQAIERSRFSRGQIHATGLEPSLDAPASAKLSVLGVAAGAILMAAGAAGWGLQASQYAAAAFHARMGVLDTPSSITWMISLFLFAVSAAFGLRSARFALGSPAK